MKITYDPRYNVAYISLRKDAPQVETVQVGADLAVDIDADGNVVGIELLNANDQLRGEGSSGLVVVNEADGSETLLPLAAAISSG